MISAENTRRINDCHAEIDKIVKWIDEHKLDDNVKFLVGYSVVKASGTIEIVMKQMLFDFLAERVKTETELYLSKAIVDSSCNPSTGNIERLLDQIDTGRKGQFQEKMKEDESKHKGDLNSLVNLRNDMAHGRNITATINTVAKYYDSGVLVLKSLDEILYPS